MSRTTKRNIFRIIAAAQLVVAPLMNAHASIPEQDRSIDLTHVRPIQLDQPSYSTNDVLNKYFPFGSLAPTTDQLWLMQKLETGLQQKLYDNITTSDFYKKSSVGQATAKVEQATKTSMVISSPSSTVQQKIDVQIRPIERYAVLMYTGYINSNFTYGFNDNNMTISLYKPVARDTTVSLTNTSPLGQLTPGGMLSLTKSF